MENGLTASDVALIGKGNEGWGDGSFMWIFALLILLFGGGFGGFNRGDYGQYATAASQQEILFGQHFQSLDNKIDKLGYGICDSTYALNNAITGEGRALQGQIADCCCTTNRNIDSTRFDMANYAASINANTTAQTQKVLDAIKQDKIEALQGKVSALELQNAMCGVVRYPNAITYNGGVSPFCNGGCGCGNI